MTFPPDAASLRATDSADAGAHALLAALPGQVAVIGPAGAIEAVNDGWRRFAGSDCDPLEGADYLLSAGASDGPGREAQARDAAAARDGVRAVLARGVREFTHDYPCHARGEDRWFRMHAVPVQWQGRPAALVQHTDITTETLGRQEAQRAARDTRQTLQLVSRAHEVLVRARDEAQLLAGLCEAAVELDDFRGAWVAAHDNGVARVNVMAQVPEGLLTPDFLRWGDGAVGDAFRQARLQFVPDVEANIRYARWAPAHVQRGIRGLLAVPLQEADAVYGVLVLYLAAERVISGRELQTLAQVGRDAGYAIAALRARAERRVVLGRVAEQAEILEKAQDAIVVRGMDHRVLYWNRGAEQVFGWCADEALGRDARELLCADAAWRAQLQDALDADESQAREWPTQRKDGSELWVQATWTLLRGSDHRPDRVLAICRDVTAIRHARDEVLRLNASLERRVQRRTRQLEAANRELEAFSYSVSHDLKAPLAAIDGFTHVLAERLQGRLEPREAGYVERVRAGVAHMFGLIDAMLSLHQISRATSLRRRMVDVSALAARVVAELRDAEPQRACSVRIEPGLALYADPALLENAVRNLVGNSWKFSARCAVTELEIAADLRAPRGFATVRFSDRGAGFDERMAGKLFTPFQRLHHAAEFPGTGVGLATVQRIVQRHGGSIRAQGQPGEGATFWLTLPLPADDLGDSVRED